MAPGCGFESRQTHSFVRACSSLVEHPVLNRQVGVRLPAGALRDRLNGRTAVSEAAKIGSNPVPGTACARVRPLFDN